MQKDSIPPQKIVWSLFPPLLRRAFVATPSSRVDYRSFLRTDHREYLVFDKDLDREVFEFIETWLEIRGPSGSDHKSDRHALPPGKVTPFEE